MPTLKECMEQIKELVKKKGFEHGLSDEIIFGKGLFAMMELSEALEPIKKHGIDILKTSSIIREAVATEIIDSIFYLLDLYGILYDNGLAQDPDEVFNQKMSRNLSREFQYGRPSRALDSGEVILYEDKDD